MTEADDGEVPDDAGMLRLDAAYGAANGARTNGASANEAAMNGRDGVEA
jgi:hypothetical protein